MGYSPWSHKGVRHDLATEHTVPQREGHSAVRDDVIVDINLVKVSQPVGRAGVT